MAMGWIGWIILGAIAGWLASIIMGTDERQGCIVNIVVGIIGALIGGLIMNFMGGQGVTGFNVWSLLVAVIGSVVLLAIARVFSGR